MQQILHNAHCTAVNTASALVILLCLSDSVNTGGKIRVTWSHQELDSAINVSVGLCILQTRMYLRTMPYAAVFLYFLQW